MITQPAFTIWLTGLPASGKTSIARELEVLLRKKNLRVVHLESDQVRLELTPKPTYSTEERDIFYRVLAILARILCENGINVLIDATGNKRIFREYARSTIPRFMEVFVRCPLEVCMARDPKGIYRNALPGGKVPGLQESYEEPTNPELMIDSDKTPPAQAAEKILLKLQESNWA